MQGKNFFLFLMMLCATAVLIFANMFVQEKMDASIRENQLVDEAFIEGAPPLVAFTTVALGGFRGIIADYLWFRTISLQEQGRYFELAQLASWIMKLQPKFTGAAAFLGWNLAYNVSVTSRTPEDRWRWVQRGIEVLTEAMRYSQSDPDLYKELGWIYQHKMGDVMDDAQRYYKYELARMMLHAYGQHFPDWDALAAAPRTESKFREIYPLDHPLWKILKGWGHSSLDALQKRFEELGNLPPELSGLPPDLQNTEEMRPLSEEDLNNLSAFLRSRWLRNVYLLDPQVIAQINAVYGELDWLMPESMAVYWATQGIAKAFSGEDTLNAERMVGDSLKVMFKAGRMLLPNDEPTIDFVLVPNIALADVVLRYYEDADERHDTNTFRHALEYFLSDAIVTLYSFGHEKKAREFFQKLRENYKENKANRMTFEQFVVSEFEGDFAGIGFKQINEFISSLIFRSCILLGYGDREAAAGHLALAKMAYNNYSARRTDARLGLPPFDQMKRDITQNVIANFPTIAERLTAELAAE